MGQENKKIIEVMYKDTRHMNSITPLGTEKSIPKNSIHIWTLYAENWNL